VSALSLVRDVVTDQWLLVSGGDNGTLYLWDFLTGQLLQTFVTDGAAATTEDKSAGTMKFLSAITHHEATGVVAVSINTFSSLLLFQVRNRVLIARPAVALLSSPVCFILVHCSLQLCGCMGDTVDTHSTRD
jgi:WD40 repeat protein